MKQSNFLIFVISFFLISSCGMFEGSEGPQGDQGLQGIQGAQGNPGNTGPQGTPGNPGAQGTPGNPGAPGAQGPPGNPGNSGAKLYVFGGNNYATNQSYFVDLPGLGPQINDYMIFVFLLDTSLNLRYPIPGPGVSGLTTYRVWWLRSGANINVRTQRSAGPGETYGEVRVIAIPITQMPSARVGSPEVDFNNYEELVRFYGL
jgi:hypothetical protein